MKEIQLQNKLNEFFGEFKNLPYSYNIEKVHHLLDDPNAVARHKVKFNFKPFKIIIMTSVVLITISAFLFKLNPGNNLDINSNEKNTIKENVKPKSTRISLTEKPLPEKSTATFNYKSQENSNAKNPEEEIFAQGNTTSKAVQEFKNNVDDKKKNARLPQAETQSCNWPADTTIDKNSLVIQLSDDELKKIGVIFKNDTLIILKDTILKQGVYYYLTRFYKRKYKPSEDIIPVYISTEISELSFVARSTGLYDACDTLLPLVVKNNKFVLWYNGTPDFFSFLPDRFKHLEAVTNNLKQIKSKTPNRCLVNYYPTITDFSSNSTNIATLKLSKEFFKKMGILIEDTIFSMVYPEYGINYTLFRNRNAIYMSPDMYKKFPNFNPVFISDELGNIEYNLYYGDSVLNYNVIVPVLVDFKELINRKGPDYWTKKIFWYYPTENFIAALPDEIRKELKLERDNILNNIVATSSSCTYFEACKSTLNLMLYIFPNPAKKHVTIEFYSNVDMKGSIALVNMSGSVVKMIVPSAFIGIGKNIFEVELSGIVPGIWLVKINTNKGFLTKKLIIAQ